MNNILRAVLQKLTLYSTNDINTIDHKKIRSGFYERGITICSKTSNTNNTNHESSRSQTLRKNEWTDTDLAIPTIDNIHVQAELHIKALASIADNKKDLAFYERARDYSTSPEITTYTHALAEQISQKIESLMRDVHEISSINQLHQAHQHANYWHNGHPYHIEHCPHKHDPNGYNNDRIYASTTITQLTTHNNRPTFTLRCQSNCYLKSNDPLEPNWIMQITEQNNTRHLGSKFTHMDAINLLWECMFDGSDIDTLKQGPSPHNLSQHAYIHALRTIEQRPNRYLSIMDQLSNYTTT